MTQPAPAPAAKTMATRGKTTPFETIDSAPFPLPFEMTLAVELACREGKAVEEEEAAACLALED